MLPRKLLVSLPIFIFIYIVQEAFVTQMRLPAGGFNLFLVFALIWAAMSTPEIGAVTGFATGLLMDLSQTSLGPMGHWTLVMILVGYLVAFLGYGDDNVRANPMNFVVLVATGVVAAQFAFVVLGLMLGDEIGSFAQFLFVLAGNAAWSALVTPLLLPVVSRIHALVYETRSRI